MLNSYMVNDSNIRLFCEEALNNKKEIFLKKNQTHYLKDVMRRSVGDRILLFDGVSGEYFCKIDKLDRNTTGVSILKKTQSISTPGDVWLIFCPLKKQRTDFLVEKCTELGVRKFFPVISQNTQTQRVTLKRLKSQVIEAVEQCGGTFIPQIEELTDLKKVVDSFPKDRRIIFCDETLEFDNIQKVLGGSNFEKVGIFIGPEGGFSLNERKMLKKKVGAVSVSLGSRVLRAETAAVSALTAWHTVSGDWVK